MGDDINKHFVRKLTMLEEDENKAVTKLAASHIKQLMGQKSFMSQVLPVHPAAFFAATIDEYVVELLIPKPEHYTIVVTNTEELEDRDEVQKFTCDQHDRRSAHACFFQAVRSLVYGTHFHQR